MPTTKFHAHGFGGDGAAVCLLQSIDQNHWFVVASIFSDFEPEVCCAVIDILFSRVKTVSVLNFSVKILHWLNDDDSVPASDSSGSVSGCQQESPVLLDRASRGHDGFRFGSKFDQAKSGYRIILLELHDPLHRIVGTSSVSTTCHKETGNQQHAKSRLVFVDFS